MSAVLPAAANQMSVPVESLKGTPPAGKRVHRVLLHKQRKMASSIRLPVILAAELLF